MKAKHGAGCCGLPPCADADCPERGVVHCLLCGEFTCTLCRRVFAPSAGEDLDLA